MNFVFRQKNHLLNVLRPHISVSFCILWPYYPYIPFYVEALILLYFDASILYFEALISCCVTRPSEGSVLLRLVCSGAIWTWCQSAILLLCPTTHAHTTIAMLLRIVLYGSRALCAVQYRHQASTLKSVHIFMVFIF